MKDCPEGPGARQRRVMAVLGGLCCGGCPTETPRHGLLARARATASRNPPCLRCCISVERSTKGERGQPVLCLPLTQCPFVCTTAGESSQSPNEGFHRTFASYILVRLLHDIYSPTSHGIGCASLSFQILPCPSGPSCGRICFILQKRRSLVSAHQQSWWFTELN